MIVDRRALGKCSVYTGRGNDQFWCSLTADHEERHHVYDEPKSPGDRPKDYERSVIAKFSPEVRELMRARLGRDPRDRARGGDR